MQPHEADQGLALRLRAGDADAFAAIFRAQYAPLVHFVRRYLGSQDAAEDVAQDVFAKLWERREAIDPSRSLRAYLYTIARHQALNIVAHDTIVREHSEHAARTIGDGTITTPSPSADAIIIADELVRTAAAKVATLSPRLREIYHLSRSDELSPQEIAEILGIAVATVHVQLAKIIKALHPTLVAWIEE